MSAPKVQVLLPIPTDDGTFVAHYSTAGLCGLDFPDRAKGPVSPADSSSIPVPVRQWHHLTTRALTAALASRPPEEFPPLDLSGGTAFQQEVWRAMRQLGPGQTASYGEVANAIGRPQAVRAVGGACGANPLPVLIPCHRVLAARRRIGGFSGGLHWKRELLAREGIKFSE